MAFFSLHPKRPGAIAASRARLGFLSGAVAALLLIAPASARGDSRYYTVRPCRLADTRDPISLYGGPALAANLTRVFLVGGRCGTSPTASAVAANVTVTGSTQLGHLRIYPGGTGLPPVSSINYGLNQTRANNGIFGLNAGNLAVYCGQPGGTTHLIVDIVGYFDDPANNQPPTVNAGFDLSVTQPASASLNGTAADDGKPVGQPFTTTWSKISGPGTVTFGNPNLLATGATFGAAGTYVLRLTASDTQLSATDDVLVVVNPPAGGSTDIVRLLEQATWGPNDTWIGYVQSMGIAGFLNWQFSMPSSGWPDMPVYPTTVPAACTGTCNRDNYSMYLLQRRFLQRAFYDQDQLRQRVAWSLHQMFVVSGRDITLPWWMTHYLQILDRNAFGNFRQLLYEITLNPAMGNYLDMYLSTRVNPNENYAREVLQLFSVGTSWLNLDGTPIINPGTGAAYPTYDQTVVDGFTRIFTGWTFQPQLATDTPNYRDPMRMIESNHDNVNDKTLLAYSPGGGSTVLPPGAGGVQDLNVALDNIFNHPNVGPFVCGHLIRQLVTSNPAPAYIARCAAAFNNNGAGVRGDLRTVVEVILLDPEARGAIKTDPNYGKLKEPAQFLTNVLRPFNPQSANGTTPSDGWLNPQVSTLDQDIVRPPTVFNYFPMDYPLPGSASLLGPEFGIFGAVTALRRSNVANTMLGSLTNTTLVGPRIVSVVAGGPAANAPVGTSIDLAALAALAGNPSGMVDELNRIMMHGAMSTLMKNSIVTAVNAIPVGGTGWNYFRARTAVYLVATSSQYNVQR